jgi:glycogen debranching enzyme
MHIAERARRVLDDNRRGDYTCPAIGFYPHQWLWDSCFTAIGIASYDAPRAAAELRALFRGQWANGMLPHMIFADGHRDVGSRRIWQSKRFADAPRDVDTSCITQPPVTAIAVREVARALPDADRTALLRELVPKLVAHHEWLYRERDPRRRGLVTLIHPWECGLDTTPPWMRTMREMRGPWWVRWALRLRLARVARFFRRDTKFAPAAERTSDDDGLRMLALARHDKRHGFDLARLPPGSSVLIEDVAFNSLLAVANTALEEVATDAGVAIPAELHERFVETSVAIDELWDDEDGQYYSRNASTDELIKISTVATFLPLWGRVVPPDRVNRLRDLLRDETRFWLAHPVPSVAATSRAFDEDRYWKGPTWVNMNWAIVQGLHAVGDDDLAAELRARTIAMVEATDCFEYFNARTGQGYGAPDFSWTAALVLDLLAAA